MIAAGLIKQLVLLGLVEERVRYELVHTADQNRLFWLSVQSAVEDERERLEKTIRTLIPSHSYTWDKKEQGAHK